MTAFMPTPKPMVTAFTRFCTGYTRDRAVMAFSLIFATKKLSMMLYRELTIMDRIIGSDMDSTNCKMGFSFM